jgi:hypothetical protein
VILAQARMELVVADLDADHLRRAGLQQAVGEAAGGLADVEADRAAHVQPAAREGAFELERAAGDEAVAVVRNHVEPGIRR